MLAKDELAAQERLAAKFQPESIDEQIRRDELVARRLAHDLNSNSGTVHLIVLQISFWSFKHPRYFNNYIFGLN